MPLTEFPIATVALADVVDTEYRYGSYFFDASKLQHVNHGRFFRQSENYSHCFWETWVKPSALQASAGYIVSDNQGGNHCILWGVQPATTGFVSVTGNFYDGTTLTSFSQSEPIPTGYWIHLAVGWDGTTIYCWTNGVLTHKQAYAPTQRMQPGGNDMFLHIGGSDHNNFWGNIAQVRAYEGYGRCPFNSDFAPDMVFRSLQNFGTSTVDVSQFCVSYQTPQRMFLDAGKFNGVSHPGVPEALQSTGFSGIFVDPDLDLPTFESEDITLGTYTPVAPTTPASPVIWDSFSRANSGYNNPANYLTGAFVLGEVEVGGVNWTNLDGTAATSGAGILNGRAYIVNGAPGKLVETSIQNMDVRVDRLPTSIHYTGIYLRYKDANDYYYVQATDTAITVYKMESGVQTTVGYTPTAGWTTLRAVANGTTLTVYTGTATEGTFTSQGSFTCTNVSGATKAGIDRPSGVGTLVYYDNFLVKAA